MRKIISSIICVMREKINVFSQWAKPIFESVFFQVLGFILKLVILGVAGFLYAVVAVFFVITVLLGGLVTLIFGKWINEKIYLKR